MGNWIFPFVFQKIEQSEMKWNNSLVIILKKMKNKVRVSTNCWNKKGIGGERGGGSVFCLHRKHFELVTLSYPCQRVFHSWQHRQWQIRTKQFAFDRKFRLALLVYLFKSKTNSYSKHELICREKQHLKFLESL